MKRRTFLTKSTLGVIGSAFLPQFLNGMDLLGMPSGAKRLIVIQLSGGNDGLNTVVPYTNDRYYKLRPNISINKEHVLKLNDSVGLNPAMRALYKLYDEGLLSIINAVGYPNPSRSHFRSMDIWHTGVPSNKYSKNGWLGGFLDNYCTVPHAAVEIDSQLSMALQGQKLSGIAVERSQSLYNSLRKPFFKELISNAQQETLSENNQGYLYKTLIQTNQSAQYLAENHHIRNDNVDFPDSRLSQKLRRVSQFIRSGFSTQVYYVSHAGFDNHANQNSAQNHLLKQYADAVAALVRSLEKSGQLDDTLIMTFSEFGRRVKENASRGTDHGKANNLFLIGKGLRKPGVYNEAADLMNLDNGDVRHQIDFRNVYSDIIRDWFNEDPSKIFSKNYASLKII